MNELKVKIWDIHKKKFLKLEDIQFDIRMSGPDGGFELRLKNFQGLPEEAITLLYTGFEDKNGKEIFAGDIVKDTFRNMQVYWNLEYGCWDLKGKFGNRIKLQNGELFSDWDEVEIIGNIFENFNLSDNNK